MPLVSNGNQKAISLLSGESNGRPTAECRPLLLLTDISETRLIYAINFPLDGYI
jgi:hypothetical protein